MSNHESPVLVTGASTGIGRKTVELLIHRGKEVYACARKQADLDKLNKLENTTAFKLDVTKPAAISSVVKTIEKQGKNLYGLVNNAGILNAGSVYTHSEEAVYEMLNINVLGPHRMTNAMLPFLFKSKGRIVNISSISGILTGQFYGLYSMSKHALEAYSDALYQNLKEFGIGVSIIEPGNFQSSIGLNFIERKKQEKKELRLLMTDAQRKQQIKQIEERFGHYHDFPEPDAVAEAIYDALYSETPKPRYLVGSRNEVEWVLKRMFVELAQMNYNHKHSLTRKELIQLLDEVLENP